jgi:hypothetical protein
LLVASAALISASCTLPSQNEPTVVDMPRASAPAKSKQPQPRVPEEQAQEDQYRAAPTEVARTEPDAPRAAIKPAGLMNMAHQELSRVMGVPKFKRIDDPAALWQYRGKRCILDIFLYADGPVYRVSHLQFRRTGTTGKGIPRSVPLKSKEAEQCFSTLVPRGTKKKG